MKIKMKKDAVYIALLVLVLAVGLGVIAVLENNSENVEPKITNDEYQKYADVSKKDAKTFDECKNMGGFVHKRPSTDYCYLDKVKYYEVTKSGLEDLNPPENLQNYTDCVSPGNSVKMSTEELSCTSWNGKTYYYEGPPVTNYEDCAKVMRLVFESNPPQCYGPDGTHFFGPTD